MPLVVVTGNPGKLAEVRAVLGDVEALELDLPELQALDPVEVVRHKLSSAGGIHPGPLLVDDTALHLSCLGGLPGPLVKWFLAALGASGLYDLSYRLGDDRAEAVTVVGHLDADGATRFSEGRVAGRIVAPRGDRGFGWDPIFEPAGAARTFAEMTAAEKRAHSMRRLALEELRRTLE